MLESREVFASGARRTASIDVRFVAATNQDLEPMIERHAFRQDLFFRLNVARIYLPALRERRKDILEIFRHYMDQFNGRYRRAFKHRRPSSPSVSPPTIGREM